MHHRRDLSLPRRSEHIVHLWVDEISARILKVRRATLSDLLHGKAALTPEMALRIEKAFGPAMDHLLRMQLAYDVAKTRESARGISIKRYAPA